MFVTHGCVPVDTMLVVSFGGFLINCVKQNNGTDLRSNDFKKKTKTTVVCWFKKSWAGSAWVAQSVGYPTLGFGSGHGLKTMRWSPLSGSELGMGPA